MLDISQINHIHESSLGNSIANRQEKVDFQK